MLGTVKKLRDKNMALLDTQDKSGYKLTAKQKEDLDKWRKNQLKVNNNTIKKNLKAGNLPSADCVNSNFIKLSFVKSA